MQSLYTSLNYDLVTHNSVYNLPFIFQLNSEYNDKVSDILRLTPELTFSLTDYTISYVQPSYFETSTSALFDSYFSKWLPTYIFNADAPSILLPLLLTLYLVIKLLSTLLLSISSNINFQFTRNYYYTYSVSREIRIQFEVVMQTIAFFIFY